MNNVPFSSIAKRQNQETVANRLIGLGFVTVHLGIPGFAMHRTHLCGAQVLGISERTSKVYAAHGVPSGLAAVALRSRVDLEPNELAGPSLEKLQDAARQAAAFSQQIKGLLRGLERAQADFRVPRHTTRRDRSSASAL